MAQPLAIIHCRLVSRESPSHRSLEEDFPIQITGAGVVSRRTISCVPIELNRRQTITVGRDPNPQVNSVCVRSPYISRTHFEIYSVVYEETDTEYQPLIYVRDCQSLSGTSVNGRTIGSKAHGVTPGYLLSQGDTVNISPCWEFVVHLQGSNAWKFPLNQIQHLETKAFQTRYHITERILGSGTFGRIHLAKDIRSGKQVCCKVLNIDRVRGLEAHEVVRSFAREAHVLAKIRHPNLLTLESAFLSRHTIYVFTELATGGDLFSMVESRGGSLPESEAKYVMYQVVRGVSYLHKHGISHRDLKAENIFLAHGPNTRTRVIIGDLGHAKCTRWGRLKTNVGTMWYQAPELHFHRDFYTESIDIWAIGMLTLFLVISSARNDLGCLKCMDQGSIDASITKTFATPSTQGILSNDGQDFVRQCLRVEPELRMTASQAKRHPWLLLSKRKVNEWTQLRDASWNPTRQTPPLIKALPDQEDFDVNKDLDPAANANILMRSTSLTPKRKWDIRMDQLELNKVTEKSPYFFQPISRPFKKSKPTDKTS